MSIVIEPASWALGLAGGLLIGVAASGLLLLNGRIAGISGVLGGLLPGADASERPWRGLFLAGLVLGAMLMTLLVPERATPDIGASWPLLLLAGLLVGVGTRMGSGCTSGHGICGLARFSRRSLVATFSFMLAGFATVLVTRHLLGVGA
jgi:uncharacterized membrane protein YedE/YeeE